MTGSLSSATDAPAPVPVDVDTPFVDGMANGHGDSNSALTTAAMTDATRW